MTAEAHAQAFLALLDADDVAPALVLQDGTVAQGVNPPYVLVYTSVRVPDPSAEPDKSDLTFASRAVRARAVCHSVGSDTAGAARIVSARVRAALLDVLPTVAGRICKPIRWVDGQDVFRDEQTGRPIFDLIDVYEFDSYPG